LAPGEEGYVVRELSALMEEIERQITAKGISDLEELHERFLEQEPERIGNARWTFERFLRHATPDVGAIYANEFMVPLSRALDANDEGIRELFHARGRSIWASSRAA